MHKDFGLNRDKTNFEEVVFGNLLRTADRLQQRIEQFLKRSGVTLAQYNVLRTVREGEPEGVATQSIAFYMLSAVPDITRLIDRMLDKGLVRRERSPQDRRVVRVLLTAKGRRIADKFEQPLVEFHRKSLRAACSQNELKRLNGLLYRIRRSLEESER